MMPKTCFFTIVSNNYRHFARTLVASVRRHTPDVDAFVAICDDPRAASDPRDAYTEIAIRELDLPKFDRFVFQYTILELNTAIKPWVIAALFDRGYERVIYFDPDIKVYGPLDGILSALDRFDIVLTPHLTDRLDDGKHPSELAILQSGSYNLGFIALKASDETRRFIGWWQVKLVRDCVVDIARGLFTDQKWIDLVPGMYAGVGVVRDPGWNVAYWNLNHRAVVEDAGAFRVNGRPLLFFHYSGFTRGAKLLSKHQDRYTMETLPPAVRALADDYAADLRRNGDEECRKLRYAFGFFPSGEPIPDLVRRCYRESFPWDEPHPDLWSKEGEAFVIDWLNRPRPEHGKAPWLTRVAATLYRLRPDLQAAFPDVEGAHGVGYALWYVENARAQAGFSEVFVAPVKNALSRGRAPVDAPAESHENQDVSTPGGEASLASVAGTDGMSSELTAASASTAQQSDAARRRIYQIAYRAAWGIRHAVKPLTTQSFRHRVRHALLRKAYFDDRYVTPPLTLVQPESSADVTLAKKPSPELKTPRGEGGKPSINVIGYLAAESGVGESARSTLRVAAAAGIDAGAVDFRVGNVARMTETIPGDAASKPLNAINIIHVNADQMFVAYENMGPETFDGRYNIGCWNWELPEFPDEWVPAFRLLDEVWAPSTFCQRAIATKSPVPVVRMPISVTIPSVEPDRRALELGDDEVVFLSMCDVLSVPERKNPFGAATAFRRAFPGTERVRLLLKISNLEHQPDLQSRILQLAAGDRRIRLVEGYLSRAELWKLIASIDCYVSLHRSEGFGLGMAEAMACGVPVIATGWSGNVDFTRPDNSLLVDYDLVALERDLGPYRRGQTWADPDLHCAADHMRRIAASADLRRKLGDRGKSTVARELTPAAIAPLVAARLAAISRWL